MSLNPNKQTFEKMISGMYMGELVRMVVVDMMEEGLMFNGHKNTQPLRTPGSFPTKYLSEIEADPVGEFDRCRSVLSQLGMENICVDDLSALRYICECVSRRQ